MVEQAALRLARLARAWQPDDEAWKQLKELHTFVGSRVRVQFFDPSTMLLLAEDEWPHPVEADCRGVVTLLAQDHLQPFLIVERITERWTGGCSGVSYLVKYDSFDGLLAPVADLYEIEALYDAT
jgi:hypothetical protein